MNEEEPEAKNQGGQDKEDSDELEEEQESEQQEVLDPFEHINHTPQQEEEPQHQQNDAQSTAALEAATAYFGVMRHSVRLDEVFKLNILHLIELTFAIYRTLPQSGQT